MIKYIFPFFLTITLLRAQPNIEWAKTFGGTNADQARSIRQSLYGGYIVAGTTSSNNGDVFGNHGGVDFWILKLDALGLIQWKKTYGGNSDEQPYSIQLTKDGGYVVVGYTLSNNGDVSGNHGYYDVWVLKINDIGVIEWQKCLGGSDWEEAWDIQQTKDGGYILAGRSRLPDGDVTANHGALDYWVVKLDSTGALEWQRSHGGSEDDMAYAVKQTFDGGYIVCGESSSNDGSVTGNKGSSDYWVLKLNYEGKIEWQKSLGGASIDRANDIIQARDGGFIVLGQTYSTDGDVTGNHGNNDYWVVRLSKTGEVEWEKAYGGSNEDFARSIQQTNDEGYILTGQTQSDNGDVIGNDGGADLWVVKISESGALQWQKTLGGTMAEWGSSVQQTNDEGYIIAGNAWSTNGDVSGVQGKNDFWVIKLSAEPSSTNAPHSTPLTIYPNPAQNSISLKIPAQEPFIFVTLTDFLGREVCRQTISNGLDGSAEIGINTLPNGFYMVNATTPTGQVFFGKVLKME
jgi:Secretion system C-terminal sorting domain